MTFLLGFALAFALAHATTPGPARAECGELLDAVVGALKATEDDESSPGRTKLQELHDRYALATSIDARTIEELGLDGPAPSGESIAPEILETSRRAVLDHSVAGLRHLPEYDPDGQIGFCFGRAMAAHFEAVLAGVADEHVRKVFIRGRFRDPVEREGFWCYHVTTAVRGRDGIWYAIDPRLTEATPLERWAAHWAAFAEEDPTYRSFDANVLFPDGTRYASYFLKVSAGVPPGATSAVRTLRYMRALAESYYQIFGSQHDPDRTLTGS